MKPNFLVFRFTFSYLIYFFLFFFHICFKICIISNIIFFKVLDSTFLIISPLYPFDFHYLSSFVSSAVTFFFAHGVFFYCLFLNKKKLFYYSIVLLFFYLIDFLQPILFSLFLDQPGILNFLFYFIDLFLFWILELSLLPVALFWIKSKYD